LLLGIIIRRFDAGQRRKVLFYRLTGQGNKGNVIAGRAQTT
jgi:hypothetical protein